MDEKEVKNREMKILSKFHTFLKFISKFDHVIIFQSIS